MRYVREAEDFYIAYTILDPPMSDFYCKLGNHMTIKKNKKN